MIKKKQEDSAEVTMSDLHTDNYPFPPQHASKISTSGLTLNCQSLLAKRESS